MATAECVFSRRWAPRPISKGTRPQSDAGINGDSGGAGRKALSAEDDAKLIFGAVFSLRNLARKIGGEENEYVCWLELVTPSIH